MPSPWKKHPHSAGGGVGGMSRLLSGLRADRGGSLVVQTGFPTSLADIVVRNRGRLKKPARKKQKRKPLPEPATLAPPSSCRPPPGVSSPARSRRGEDRVSPPQLSSDEARRTGSGVVSGFLLVMTLVMVALAIGREKLVAGITLSASVLWLLDSIGLRVGRGSRCSEARRRLNSALGRWDLDGRGVVSPIREIGIGSCSSSVGSEGSSLESIDSDQASKDLLEKKDFVAVRKDFPVYGKGNSKAKKLFRKLVPKKFRAPKDTRDREDLSERGILTGITEIKEEEEEEIDAGDDAVLSGGDALLINVSHKFSTRDEEDMEVIEENRSGIRSRSSYQLVLLFCTIVLLGLLGGKSVALLLCLAWFLFHKSIKFL